MVFFLLFWEWGDTDSLVLGTQIGVCQPQTTDQRVEYWLNDNWKGKVGIFGENPVQVPLCPPQILDEVQWD
jgi:hypothetical protein